MRILGLLISFGRFLFGVTFIAKPRVMEQLWIGKQARLPGAQLLARAVGARDLTLGIGGMQALAREDGSSARPWLAAAAVSDAVDFGATLAAGPTIPRDTRNGVLAVAAAGALLSALAAAGLGRGAESGPVEPAPYEFAETGAAPGQPVTSA
jgi:hypothetical protein